MMPEATVFIVDDDPAIRDSLSLLLGLKGFRTQCFASAEDFILCYRPEWPGCLILDIRMPSMSGLELQAALNAKNIDLPIVIITAHGDMAMTRHTLKAGAIDFLEKPLDEDLLVVAVSDALDRDTHRRRDLAKSEHFAMRQARLTPREREVLKLLINGKRNCDIADILGISPRTVEVFKARVMGKMETETIADLIRMAVSAASAGKGTQKQ